MVEVELENTVKEECVFYDALLGDMFSLPFVQNLDVQIYSFFGFSIIEGQPLLIHTTIKMQY